MLHVQLSRQFSEATAAEAAAVSNADEGEVAAAARSISSTNMNRAQVKTLRYNITYRY